MIRKFIFNFLKANYISCSFFQSSTQITIYHENNVQQETSITLKKIFSISPIVNALIFCNTMVKKCILTSIEKVKIIN